MTSLHVRQEKIQAKRKQTPFRDFVRDICSWYPFVLYKNNGLVSTYPDTPRSCPVVSHQKFIESIDQLTQSGQELDISISFFDNFNRLFHSVPFSSLYNYSAAEKSDFAFSVFQSNNCYLSFTVITDCENILYSFAVKESSSNVLNSTQVNNNAQNIFSSHCVVKSFAIFYSKFIENSSDIWFSSNLINCHECIFCQDIENKKYCIENTEYTKEEYLSRKANILAQKDKFPEYAKTVSCIGKNHGSTDVVNWNFVLNSQGVESGKYCSYLKDARNVIVVGSPHENRYIYDTLEAWAMGNSHFYAALNAWVSSEHIYICEWIVTCYNVYYSRFLENCKFCIWCIGLKNKEYCILNKQYSKEEREKKADEIFSQMDQDGSLGEFFPATINPFYFNDTIACLIDTSFTKEEITKLWYLRRDEPVKVDIPAGAEVVKVGELDDYEGFDTAWNRSINPDILKKIIVDDQWNYYRIVKMEYDFLVKHGLPLPRKHRLDRMKENFKLG